LAEAGHEVRAAATDDALHFVTKLSLAVAAGGSVFDRAAWFQPDGEARHISWARWADALLVAPATADALSSAATARADDVISALILAGVPQVVWVPAMNPAMWQHPLVQHNVRSLQSVGHHLIAPAVGALAAKGEGSGVGRMPEPEEIALQLSGLLGPRDLEGRRVLISAGPTREPLDPVRYLSNPSSGKMGFAVAEAARDRGAAVTLVTGPVALPDPAGVATVRVERAEEMLAALSAHFDATDLVVMSAAVADWQAAEVATEKQPKGGERQTLDLVRTPDILTTLVPPQAAPGRGRLCDGDAPGGSASCR
jgi:phosphopantothenoylcysteine decarboxylase/phosphopantothenate--cysteine ligase